MNLYDIMVIEREIEIRAEQNGGEISDEEFKNLVEYQTTSIIKIENLCKYVRHLELFQAQAKEEINRINELKKKAEKRVNSIKKYMTPYVMQKGSIDAGTFKLSTRKSKSVDLSDEFFRVYEQVENEYLVPVLTFKPDKKKIKQDIEDGNEIPGARIITKENLQIK